MSNNFLITSDFSRSELEEIIESALRFKSGAIANWLLSMAGRGEGYFHRAREGTAGSLVIPIDRSGKPLRLTVRRDGKDIVLSEEEQLALVNDENDMVVPRGAVVYDLIYHPSETKLLKTARAAGAFTLGGLGMLVHQGVAAFELWTGRAAPLEVMRRAVREADESNA